MMKIGHKLLIVRLVFIGVIAFLVWASSSQFQTIKEKFTDLRVSTLEDIYTVSSIKDEILEQELYLHQYVLQNNEEAYNQLVESHNATNKHIAEMMQNIQPSIESELQLFEQAYSAFESEQQTIIPLMQQNKQEQAIAVLNNMDGLTKSVNEQSVKLLTAFKDVFDVVAKDNESLIRSTIITFMIFLALSLIISFFVGRYIKKTIVQPLSQVEAAIQSIANGDLTGDKIVMKSKDEIASLANSFNELHSSIKQLIFAAQDNAHNFSAISTQLSANVNTVLAASGDISINAENISDGTKQAAQIASDTSHAMEETAKAVSSIAESTVLVHEKAVNTNRVAKLGDATIQSVNTQMDEIYDSTKLMVNLIASLGKSSEEIRQMTKVITDITDQTNLLSLNAAIEAARAGEHGKGFAVVADEVRKLADQSNKSAAVIEQLTNSILVETKHVQDAVTSSLRQVETGVVKIEEAGQAFYQITAAIGDIVDSVAEVSAVTEEISATTEQVSASVNELSKSITEAAGSTEQISQQLEEQLTSVEDVSSVTTNINQKVTELTALVDKYKLA